MQRVIVEIGCGRGQLTIPLARRVKGRFLLVDSFSWPYSGSYRLLLSGLLKEGLKGRTAVVKRDYKHFLSRQASNRFDSVISSEFLPEIDSVQLSRFLSECHRVLKRGAVTAHSFLSPIPRNPRQRLLIEADTNPRWTKTPPVEWFSPTRDLVTNELRRSGFSDIKTIRLKSHLIVRGGAARTLLRDWDVRDNFWKAHKSLLLSEGLEIPDWIITVGSKP